MQSSSVLAVVLSVHYLTLQNVLVSLVDQHFYPFAINVGHVVLSPLYTVQLAVLSTQPSPEYTHLVKYFSHNSFVLVVVLSASVHNLDLHIDPFHIHYLPLAKLLVHIEIDVNLEQSFYTHIPYH